MLLNGRSVPKPNACYNTPNFTAGPAAKFSAVFILGGAFPVPVNTPYLGGAMRRHQAAMCRDQVAMSRDRDSRKKAPGGPHLRSRSQLITTHRHAFRLAIAAIATYRDSSRLPVVRITTSVWLRQEAS